MIIDRIRKNFKLLILFIFVIQFFGINIVSGNLISSKVLDLVYMTDIFSGIELIISSKSLKYQLISGLILIITIYIILGRAFCGWVCPVDLIFSYTNKKNKYKIYKINNRIPIIVVVITFFILISFLLSQPIFITYISPITNFFRILFLPFSRVEFTLIILSIILLLVVIIIDRLNKRFWCKDLCPIGFMYGLLNKISVLKIQLDKKRCKVCYKCNESCPMSIDILNTTKSYISSVDCILCGKCIDACKHNALKFTIKTIKK